MVESMLSVMLSRMNPSSCLGSSSSGDFLNVDDDEVRDDGVPPSSIVDKKSSPRSTTTNNNDGSSSSMANVEEAASACSIIDCSLFGPDNELYLKKIDELWDKTFIYNHPVDDNDNTCDNNVAENNDDEMETTVLNHLHQVVPTLLSRISAKYPTPSPYVPRINSTDLAKCADPATAIIRQKEQNVCDVYGSEALQELHDLTITATATATTTNNRKNDRVGKKGALIYYYRLLMIHRSDVCGGNIVEILSRVLVGRSSSSSSIGNRHCTKKNENYSSYGGDGGGEDEESFDYSLDDTLFGGGNKGSLAQHRQRIASGKYGPSSLAANEDRRLACWTLCNLAMPHENKLAMLRLSPPSPFLSSLPSIVSSSINDEQGITSRIKVGEEGEQQKQDQQQLLLQALTCVIGRNLPESYLCFICLLNLTYCTENSRIVVYYIPPTTARLRRKLNNDDDNDKLQQKHCLPSSQLCGSRIRSRSEPIIVSRIGGGSSDTSSNDDDKTTKMYKPSMMSRRGISLNILDKVGNGNVVPSQHCVGILSSIDNNNQLSTMDQLVLCNPSSLLRIIERSMNTNYSYAFGSVQSVQGEAIRWACGLIRNLTRTSPTVVRGGGGGGEIGNDVEVTTTTNDKLDSISSRRIDSKRHGNNVTNKDEKCLLLSSPHHLSSINNAAEEVCTLLSQTTIPKLLIQLISTSPRSSIEWTCNSLEDACLGTMCNMAIWPAGLKALQLAGVTESKCLRELERVPGIHGYRAKALRCSLGALS
jgi:hypothetical protein